MYCVCVRVCVCLMCEGAQGDQKRSQTPGAAGSYKLPDLDAGTKLGSSISKQHTLLTTEPFL